MPGLAAVDRLTEGKGYLDGRVMASTFNMLRSNDLIWNYVVNNYLLGKDYFPFDLLYWNGDATNVPAKWHKSYLEDIYRDNKLVVPGAMSVAGVPIDLTRGRRRRFIFRAARKTILPRRARPIN